LHLLVCIKQVPNTNEIKIDPKTNTLDRSGATSILNPYDAHAVEEAVRWKRALGGTVSVLTMGPPQAKEVIQKSVELGADRGYLLTDKAFAGSDTLATSYILSTAVQKIASSIPVDLVFCGKQAIDGDTAQVGPGIASRLNIPQLTYVERIIEIKPEQQTIKVQRHIDGGHEIVESKLPCLVTVEKEINELTYAPLPDMIRAVRYHPVVWSVSDLDADINAMGLKGSPTAVKKIFTPKQRAGGEIWKGKADELAKKLVPLLIGDVLSCRQ